MSAITAGAMLPQPQGRHFFTEKEWHTTVAITSRIFPTTCTTGAHELGVVCFIDRMLASEYSNFQAAWREGIRNLAHASTREFGREFEKLNEREQDRLLSMAERSAIAEWKDASAFFELARLHTIEGVLSDPKYGGNFDGLGWNGLI